MNSTLLEHTQPVATYIVQDDLLVDPETGESLGYVAPDGGHIFASAVTPSTPKVEEGFVNWVLRKMLTRTARKTSATAIRAAAMQEHGLVMSEYLMKASLDERAIEHALVIANCEKIIAKAEKELAFFELVFSPMLKIFAQAELIGQTGRTWASAFGSISLTKIGGGLAVTDKVKFIAWAEKSAPDAVKKEPLISKVPKGTVASAENGLSVVAIDDKVTLSFGVTK